MSLWLVLEIVVAGVVAAWLLALVPAGAITLLKERWDLFGWGFLTFGLPWFSGALAMAPPDSGWARRRYDEEQLVRAALPFERQYSSRTRARWALATAVAVVLLGALAMRPAPVLGLSGETIGHSVPHRGGGLADLVAFEEELGPCEHEAGKVWTCGLYDAERSGGTIEYEVEVGGDGCWTATPSSHSYSWGRLHGCVSILNYFE